MNCSSQCESALCFIHAGVNRQEGLEIMQRLCGLSTVRAATNVPPRVSAASGAPGAADLVPHVSSRMCHLPIKKSLVSRDLMLLKD